MIVCDTFEANVTVVGDRLVWRYWTDLPAGTRVGLDVRRLYTDHTGGQCLWTLHDAALTAMPGAHGDFNGGSGEVSVVAGDLAALREFEESLNHLSSGMATPPADVIQVSFVVGARQPLKAFGRNNCNLQGDMVAESGGIKCVRVTETVASPLSPEAAPFEGESGD